MPFPIASSSVAFAIRVSNLLNNDFNFSFSSYLMKNDGLTLHLEQVACLEADVLGLR